MLPSQEFVYTRTYARWLEEVGRRETWEETTKRVINFLREQRPQVPAKVFRKLESYMLKLEVLPSMRLVWAAGPAAATNNVTIYNCSFLAMCSVEDFAEMLYILMCGTGVGFSVESYYVEQLPAVTPLQVTAGKVPYVISDDKAGWADSVKFLMDKLYRGEFVEFDYSRIRPKGARLLTMGGRASGPEPLANLHRFITEVFFQAQGRKLLPIEVHDICNKIAESVVVGGVRRSSQISLSDLEDEDLRKAKNWPYPLHRVMANNSAVYHDKPDSLSFIKEWYALAASNSGERGIFNLSATKSKAPSRRLSSLIAGTNPCGEIALRNHEFCNLSTIIVRQEDSLDTLLDKAETAAWVGTIQASFTDFPYLRPSWKKNCEEEALLGVSLSGQMDNPKLLSSELLLETLKNRVLKTNKKAAKILSIKEAAATTCGKPEGTTGQLTNSGSGCHPWYSRFFIRRYRISANDPLVGLLRLSGVELKPEVGQEVSSANTFVIEFPVAAPVGAVTRENITALEQLEWYKHIQKNWCEHNQSITIYVKPDEWLAVGNWVYSNWDIACGLSFLPYDGGHYQLAPYEEITEQEYIDLVKAFPKIDYTKLSLFETEDTTEGAKNYACVGDKCELR